MDRTRPPLSDVSPVLDDDSAPARLDRLERRMRTLENWEARMGSYARAVWHWRLAFLLMGLVALIMAIYLFRPRPDILPYVMIWDPEGHELWRGVPGSYRLTDVIVMEFLADFIKLSRTRPAEREGHKMLADNWREAVIMTKAQSEARATFSAYMDAEYATLTPTLRVELQFLTKAPPRQGVYRLTWVERHITPAGKVDPQQRWEGEFTVELTVPKTREEVEVNRRGIWITSYSWSPMAEPGVN